jgi:hypothetical protein
MTQQVKGMHMNIMQSPNFNSQQMIRFFKNAIFNSTL